MTVTIVDQPEKYATSCERTTPTIVPAKPPVTVINVSGSLVLGVFLAITVARPNWRPATRLFVATGFLGGYTTFSTFGYETVRLIQDGHAMRAALYVAASLTAGLAAVVVGMAAARSGRIG